MNNDNDMQLGAHPSCVPKLIGADAELGNLILGVHRGQPTGHQASRAVLREIDGVSAHRPRLSLGPGTGLSSAVVAAIPAAPADWPYTHDDPQNTGRKYLASNGGCAYIDLEHIELCTPEVRSAHDFVAVWHAMLRIARGALAAANATRPDNERIVVLVNSSDGLGNAYGSHLNFLLARRLFDDMFIRRLHPSLFLLAAYQISSIVFTGQGKVGAENGRPPVAYQLSQRADFFEQIVALQTTHERPIVNSRDEPLCGRVHAAASGDAAALARLHCIFYDSTLCQVATLLKVGVMQIVLCMLEAQRLDASLMLADPLAALVSFSHDPTLAAQARLVDGRRVNAVELQSMFCARARTFVDSGGCAGLVPAAAEIVDLWEHTLGKLTRRDFDALASRLDWVAKRAQIERALAARTLDWSSPQAKHLDHLYADLNHGEGLYWALEAAGGIEKVIGEARIQHFEHAPPDDTRAWTRAMLLQRIPRARIRRLDWDYIELSPLPGRYAGVRLDLADPLAYTREHWLNGGFEQLLIDLACEQRSGIDGN